MTKAVPTHGQLVSLEEPGIQSISRNTRFGDHEGVDSRPQNGGSFGSSKTLPLGTTFTGSGVNWPSSIWTTSSTTAKTATTKKDLGSVGCEALKPKSNRDQPPPILPSYPWNKQSSTWTSSEPTASSSISRFTPTSMTSHPRESKLASTSPLPLLRTEFMANSPTVPKQHHSRPFVAQAIDTKQAVHSGQIRGHPQSSTSPNNHPVGRPFETFVPEHSVSAFHSDEWEEIVSVDNYRNNVESYYASRQTTPNSTGSMPSTENEGFASDHFSAASFWPQNGTGRTSIDNQWHTKYENGNHSLQSTNIKARTTYNDRNVNNLTQRLDQNVINDHDQISSEVLKRWTEPGELLSHQISQSAFTSDHASLLAHAAHSAQVSHWKPSSHTWESQERQPLSGQSYTARSFPSQQQYKHDSVSTGSRNHVDESEGLFNIVRGNSLVPYRSHSSFTPQNILPNHMRAREMPMPSQDHDQYLRHPMQNFMLYQMRNSFPYPLGLGYNEASITNFSPYMHFSQLLLQPRPPPLGLVPQADAENGLRSVLLEEFRNNVKGTRRFELRDIYDHVVEFSGDQQGARFIQTKLETANSAEKDRVFRELSRDAVPLMKDVFGNWVIQKFFEHGDQNQKRILVAKMKGQVLELTLQMYGCRVVQRALEHVLVDEKVCLVKELAHNVLRCVKDQHGNHVIQKAIEVLPTEYVQFILDALVGQIQHLSTHNFGCRVVQRLLERSQGHSKRKILQELHICASALIGDQYGNYVVQNALEHGETEDRMKLNAVIKAHLVLYSKQKFASNVVEATLKFGTNEFRQEIMQLLTMKNERGESEVMTLLKDPFGNYVIQKLQETLNPEDKAYFTEQLKTEVDRTSQASASYRQAHNRLANEMRKFDNSFHMSHQMQTGARLALDESSARSTPPLIMDDAQSIISSSLPSVVGDSTPLRLVVEHQAHIITSDIKIEITHS